MENFPKTRGRPRKIPESRLERPDVPDSLREIVGEALYTERSRNNAYYAEIAEDVVEGLKGQVSEPADPVLAARLRLGMDWISSRRTVLTELGRLMDEDPDPGPDSVRRFQYVTFHLAERHQKLSAKDAVAYVRRQRRGPTERRDRVAALHHDLNAAINHHRKRYPESTWPDIARALDLTSEQIQRKLG
jgi:hypothetical protein